MAEGTQAQGGSKAGLFVLIAVVGLGVGGVVVLQKKAAQDAQKALVDGKVAYEAKKWEDAYTLLEKGLKIADDADAKTKAADARKNHRDALVADAAKAPDADAALATLEKAQAISPDPAVATKINEAQLAAGKAALDAKKYDRAVALLASSTHADAKPLLADARYQVALEKKDDAEALVAFRAAGAHKDAADRVAALEPKLYGQAKDAMHRNDLPKAKALLSALGSYKDSAKLLSEAGSRAGTPKATWAMVGKQGDYKGTKLLVALDGCCWSVDGGGTLWKTTEKGEKSKVGKGGTWQKTAAVVAMDGLLYSVEKDGTVYKTDKTGKYDEVGKGSFGDVRALVALDGSLYSLEGGDLYKTEVATWKWNAVGGRGEWKDTRILCGFKGKIWSVEQTGTLYRTKPNGNFEKVGKDGDWKDTQWMVCAGDFVYSVEKNGTLYRTDATGVYKQVGDEGGFKDTAGIAAEGETVWTIEGDGSLYRTVIKAE